MYANRYAGSRGSRPVSLGASLLITGGMVLGLVYAAPNVIPAVHKQIDVVLIPLDQPPPPEPQPHPAASPTITQPVPFAPSPRVPTPADQPPITVTTLLPPPGPVDLGTGIAAQPQPTPSPLPALVAATADQRYADDFQPVYPPEERRAGNEGRVVVRVLIGIDGRVEQVEKVSAASDAFYAATRAQALAKWRFRPATRGAVPVESWKTMGVTFRLQVE